MEGGGGGDKHVHVQLNYMYRQLLYDNKIIGNLNYTHIFSFPISLN